MVWPAPARTTTLQADRGVDAEGLVGQGRVAGTQDQVILHLLAEPVERRGPHIDLGQHAEALGPERLAHAGRSPANGACVQMLMR